MRLLLVLSCGLGVCALSAADLKPDATTEIPASAKREVVIKLDKSQISDLKSQIPGPICRKALRLQLPWRDHRSSRIRSWAASMTGDASSSAMPPA